LAGIEVGQGLVVAAGLDIDHGAGVMITDDGQVPVRMAVTDLIDPDPVEGVEPAGIKQLGHTAVDDRGHRFPGAAQQGGHRGAVGSLSKPEHHVFEVAGMPRSGPCPRQLLGADPAVRAVQSTDLIYQPQPTSGQVQVPPAASAAVIDRRAQHPARAAQQSGVWAQGDLDVALSDNDIGHRCSGDLQQTVKCSIDAHAVPPGCGWCGNPET